jgi:hypothetical protein
VIVYLGLTSAAVTFAQSQGAGSITGPIAYIATAPPSTAGISTPVQLRANAPFGTPGGDASQPDGTNARRLQLSARFRF